MKIRILSAIDRIGVCFLYPTFHRRTASAQPMSDSRSVSIRFASEPAEPGTKVFSIHRPKHGKSTRYADRTRIRQYWRTDGTAGFHFSGTFRKKRCSPSRKGQRGTTCDFYAVANTPVANITTKTGLLALLNPLRRLQRHICRSDDQARSRGRRACRQCDKNPLQPTGSQTDVTKLHWNVP